ncbi:MAG TPA: L,D-transpeptidase family protein [Chitinophagaceae bacterium]|nr:L,D-transpeptidase family protein [Chitinophagaceae bacterium]HRF18751.1 L,D-transpeptidase family protein [Chitinophagaceae bacterium]
MKSLLTLITLTFFSAAIVAQPPSSKSGGPSYSFVDYQRAFPRPGEAMQRKLDTLQKQFEAKKLQWPAKYMYIRSFKYDSQLEVWVKNEINAPFQLFKAYKVCALAGTLGPKRMEGDYQVPEGFYYINEFNPKSNYYLSLGINYPNASDKILSDSLRPGSAIYIHGSCVTVGCIPITDQQIDELYILAAHAKDQGQDFIPVHIFPVRFDKEKSVSYLEGLTKDDPVLKKFAERMEDAFDYFEKYKQLPVVMVGEKGEYIINEVPPKKAKLIIEDKQPVKKPPMARRTRNIIGLADAVHQWPQFPGGTDAFMKYLEQTGREAGSFLPKGVKKAYIQLEFIIDKDGVPVNFKILKSIKDADELEDELISRLENMGTWKPAILHDKPVAKKMIQTITIETP